MTILPRATSVIAKGDWDDASDSVILELADRRANHLHLQGLQGLEFMLDLTKPLDLRGGDAVALEDGRLIEIVAAPESLIEIKGEPHQIANIAWHLGNRHVPLQISGAKIRVQADAALAELAVALGAKTTEIEAPFDPEGGNYAHSHAAHHHKAHRHDHTCNHGHGHKHHDHHGHDHHDHDHHGHVHGPDCKHDH